MKNKYPLNQYTHRSLYSTGFTLVEVLASMIVVSVGLLGVAGLVVESQKNSFEVYQRSAALELGNDLLGRINANPDALASYVSDLTSIPTQPDKLCNAANSNCSNVELAAFDLWQWAGMLYGTEIKTTSNNNAGGLVLPMACITRNGSILAVSIVWRGKFAKPDQKGTVACGDDDNQYKLSNKNDLRRVMTLTTRIG